MSRRLQGKIAIVFGAGSVGPGWGNSKATAALFGCHDAHVACVDINRAAADGGQQFNDGDRSAICQGRQAGIDFIKDDELQSEGPDCPFDDRVQAAMAAIDRQGPGQAGLEDR